MYVAVWFFVLYKPPQQPGGMEQDMHLHIGKCSRDLMFLHFGAISLAQDGTFQCLQQSAETDWNGMDWNVFLNYYFFKDVLVIKELSKKTSRPDLDNPDKLI